MAENKEMLQRKMAIRSPLRANITKLCKEINALVPDFSTETSREIRTKLVGKLENLKKCEVQIKNLNCEIEELTAIANLSKEIEEVLQYNDCIGEAICAAEEALKIQEPLNNSVDSTVSSKPFKTVKLPTLEFPKFDGSLTKWAAWWERFKTSIHNNSALSPVDKFNYLNSLLTGIASASIAGLSVTEANYNEAISRLEKRFGKEKAIVEAHLSKLLHLNPLRSSELKDLRSFLDFIVNNISSLKSLNVKPETYQEVLFAKIKESLTSSLLKEFRLSRRDPNLNALLEFLQEEVEALEEESCFSRRNDKDTLGKSSSIVKGSSSSVRRVTSSVAALTTSVEARKPFCIFCSSKEHWTDCCTQELDVQERKDILKRRGRCFRCTRPRHTAKDCKVKVECGICKGRHHSLLHESNSDNVPVVDVNVNLGQALSQTSFLLQTAQVKISSPKSTCVARILLDGGSQRSFILRETCAQLNLPTLGFEEIVLGVFGGEKKRVICRRVSVSLASLYDGQCLIIEALEIDKICAAPSPLPTEKICEFFQGSNLQFADPPTSTVTKNIQMLIGVDFYGKMLKDDAPIFLMNDQRTFAFSTLFGWVVSGPCKQDILVDSHISTNVFSFKVSVISEEPVSESSYLEQFWKLEHLGVENSANPSDVGMTLPDPILKDNRFEVSLPWLDGKQELLESNLVVARKRFSHLAKKLSSTPNIMSEYDKTLKSYLTEGIIEKVPDSEKNELCYYLPHRAVIKKDRATTKLRVVFDGSSHANGCLSLNDCLWQGPDLLNDLLLLLYRFRTHPVAVVADVTKAFLQISLAEVDRNFTRFFWIENGSDAVVYRFTRLPFGITSSPALLNSTMQYLFELNSATAPETVAILKDSFYVDDLVTSVPSVKAAEKLQSESKSILQQGSFELHGWSSNSHELMHTWNNEVSVQIVRKVLGLVWDTEQDYMSLSVPDLVQSDRISKRLLLSEASRIYDPLGLASPFVVRVKILLQEIWKLRLDWDSALPDHLQMCWADWVKEISALKDVHIPRCLITSNTFWDGQVQLHTFVDASMKAYAAVSFLLFEIPGGFLVRWVSCKTRVAPLKELTLPRLELMSAVLGVRLANTVDKAYNGLITKRVFWTDSKIALGWITSPSYRWKPFVANRVEEIQKATGNGQWCYCPGQINPADLPSRGGHVEQLKNWIQGPPWLSLPCEQWPQESKSPEVIICELNATAQSNVPVYSCLINYDNFSLLGPLLRTVACFQKSISKFKCPNTTISLSHSASDLKEAEMFCIKEVQNHVFTCELLCLKKGARFPQDSSLNKLSCFLDDKGILRLQSRICNSNLEFSVLNPVILGGQSNFILVLIRSTHLRLKHAGITETLAELRSYFWIIRGRQLVKRVVSSCMACRKLNTARATSATGKLPASRSVYDHPFKVTGVDFAGPLLAKSSGDLPVKNYIALFTCSVTRAIHLELVSDLSSHSFLLSFKRFIARRGIPAIMYSDNGKTFKKADADLQKLAQLYSTPESQSFLASYRIEWRFIVEQAPWWGGHWERLVRSVKDALKRTLGKSLLCYEDLMTILIEIEAVINSRPLTAFSDGTQDKEPLTPSHFLIGQRLTFLPDPLSGASLPTTSTSLVLRKRIRQREQLLNSLAHRWKNEYILLLKSVHSCPQAATTPLNVGDLILLAKEKTPRHMWPLGRIVDLHIGRDGVARSALLLMSNGSKLRRPVSLLVPLKV